MVAFGAKAINYFENRADNGIAWTVRYDLSFRNGEVLTTIRTRLVGDDPGAIETQWERGINDIWNNKVFFSDGTRLYEVKLDFEFVNSGQHHTVRVHAGTGRDNITDWYLDNPGGHPNHMQDELAAHETGHMFGLYDEYQGGGTFNNFTTTGTLMADLTLAGFERFFWTQEFYTELYGRTTLSTVLGIYGGNSADTLTGTAGMNGFYGLRGNDTISGLGGNDFLDGGRGRDFLSGGGGADIFDFDSINETSNSRGARDVITDFRHRVDDIDLSAIDASRPVGGNNSFVWRGLGGFTGSSDGELRFQKFNNAGTSNDYTVVYGDTDRDNSSEFQIELKGLVNLTSADFAL